MANENTTRGWAVMFDRGTIKGAVWRVYADFASAMAAAIELDRHADEFWSDLECRSWIEGVQLVGFSTNTKGEV